MWRRDQCDAALPIRHCLAARSTARTLGYSRSLRKKRVELLFHRFGIFSRKRAQTFANQRAIERHQFANADNRRLGQTGLRNILYGAIEWKRQSIHLASHHANDDMLRKTRWLYRCEHEAGPLFRSYCVGEWERNQHHVKGSCRLHRRRCPIRQTCDSRHSSEAPPQRCAQNRR